MEIADIEDFIEMDVGDFGNKIAEKNDMILLVDADTVAFTACLGVEEEIMVLPADFYTQEEWEEIASNDTYNPETGMYYTINMDEALIRAESKLTKMLDRTGCRDVELHFTGGKCFRYEIYPAYKDNRKDFRTPAGLKDLKKMLLEKYVGDIHTQWEADEVVVLKKSENPDKYLLAAVDKDVLNAVPGEHLNYYESNLYNIDMKMVEVTEKHSIFWPYLQCILGDTSDNIIGVHGLGPKKALKYVNEDMTEPEMWLGLVKAYESVGRHPNEAHLNMNLVNMKLLHNYDGQESNWKNSQYCIIPWEVPSE